MDEGLCLCGCGHLTNLIDRNDRSRGLVKGEYRQYLPGHHRRGVTEKNSSRFRGVVSASKIGNLDGNSWKHDLHHLLEPLIDPDLGIGSSLAAHFPGEYSLMVAVMEDAWVTAYHVRNVCLNPHSRNFYNHLNFQHKQRLELEEWLKERDSRYLFSFLRICETLNMDVENTSQKFWKVLGGKSIDKSSEDKWEKKE